MKYTKQAVLLAYKNGVLPRLRKQMIIDEVGKRYDKDDEIAIIIHNKTDEIAEHNAYVEQCKKTVDEYINEVLKAGGANG